MRFLALFLILPVLVSCQSTSIEDEFAEFEPKAGSQEQSAEAKAMKTFASYDPEKKSSFDGKKFEGKESSLRSRYENKDAFTKDAFKEHPYFKLHDNKTMANKVYNKTEAREGNLTSSYQGNAPSPRSLLATARNKSPGKAPALLMVERIGRVIGASMKGKSSIGNLNR